MPVDDRPLLTAAQQRVLDLLKVGPEGRPRFPADVSDRLRAELDEALAPLAEGLPGDESLWISKHRLADVHGCEARFVAEEEQDFAWTPALARGVVAHKAIELGVHWPGDPDPLELVDEAMARLTDGNDNVGPFLQTLTDADRAELRALANERVAAFLEAFPPLERRWRPVTESRVRVESVGGRVVLGGKVDLTIGHARGPEAGKVLVDLKTGTRHPVHRDDLRFYALLETIKVGTPPRLLASFYLDAGEPEVEAVTEPLLDTALARAVDGAVRAVELLHHDHPPARRPSGLCRWCPLLETCDEGRAHLAGRAIDDGLALE